MPVPLDLSPFRLIHLSYTKKDIRKKEQELLHLLILTVPSKWIPACLSLQIIWPRLNLPTMPAFSPLLKNTKA
jgi:hypothetical protein